MRIVSVVLVLMGLLSTINEGNAQSLKAAVQEALNQHPSVRASIARTDAQRARLEQSNRRLSPTVDLDADIGKQYVDRPNSLPAEDNAEWWMRRQATITAKYVLFDGWERANRIYRDAARMDALSREVFAESETLALNVIESYIDHRRHHFLLRIADENIQNHKRILSLTRARVEGGKATPSEVDQVQERLYAARAVRAEILQSVYEADAKFKAAVGREPKKTRPVKYPRNLPKSRKKAVHLAHARNSSIAAAEAEATAQAYELDRTGAIKLPTVSLEGSAQIGADLNAVPGHNNDLKVMLRLNWQLLDGGVRDSRIDEAAAIASEAKLKRDLKRIQIREAVERNWGKLVATGERLKSISQRVKAAKRVSGAYQQQFEASKRSLLDLLDSQNAVFSSRFEEASVSGVRLFTAYHLKALTGTLLDSLGVSVPSGYKTNYRSQIPSELPKLNIFIEPLR